MFTKRSTEFSLKELGIKVSRISKGSFVTVEKLQSKGFEAYLVGGAVRDLLLGLNPKDYDVATSATPRQIKNVFRNARIIGRRFQIVHVHNKNELIEVSTFRKNVTSKSSKNNQPQSENIFGTLEEDVTRRDLTVNALMLCPIRKVVIDHTNGINDIKAKTLRIIGTPKKRYTEDPVRMMRILRLAAKLDCKIAFLSMMPIKSMSEKLNNIPQSRLLDELQKMMSCGSSCQAFKLMYKNNVMYRLFPHLKNLDKETLNFIDIALQKNDQLVRAGKHHSLSFVISALYWPTVSFEWNDACENKKANMKLMTELFNNCSILENSILTHGLRSHVRKIWENQSRLFKLKNRAKAMGFNLNDYSAQKSLAFLSLRNEADEISSDLPDWWYSFNDADKDTKRKMVVIPKLKATRKRSKKAAAKHNEAASS